MRSCKPIENPKSTFAERVHAAKPRTKRYDVWDDVTTGLALRVGTSGHRSFFLRRTVRGRIRSTTIGSVDTMTVPEARREARKLIATFIEPARQDNGPRTPGRPVDVFAEEFLAPTLIDGLGTVRLRKPCPRPLIGALSGLRNPDAFLFPKHAGSRHAHRLAACWRTVCADAKLGKLRLHDLRHTAASHAVVSDENLPLVGKLLGHRQHSTTAGYARLADIHLVETAAKVGSIIAQAMKTPLKPRR